MIGGDHSATPAVVSITSAKGRKNLLADTSARYVDPSAIDLTKARRCPFCADAKDGGAVVEYHDDACDPPLMYRYTCMGCACEGPSKESAAEAIDAWNSRAALTLDDLPRLTDEDREAVESGYVALQGVPVGTAAHADPPTTNDDQQDVWLGVDELYAARAILECYIESIPDSRADDRYVLWAVRDKIDAANSIIQATSARPQVAHG